MSSEPGVLQARGDRVRVCTVRAQDVAPYRLAVEQSRQRLSRWNPVDPEDLERHLAVQSHDHRTFLVHALDPEGDHDIVGKINVVDVVRGRFESAAIGYDAYDPYAGRGLFADGLRLVLDLAFAPGTSGGMGLHRIAAAVQPGNLTSAGLLRSLGFAREGFSPRMLWLPGADGVNAWQDHVLYVVRRENWPTEPYATAHCRKVVVLVNGLPGPGKSALGRQLATELGIPLFARDVITDIAQESVPGVLWALLQDSPTGGVLERAFRQEDASLVLEGLRGCGLDPARALEVWCSSEQAQESARPLGLGPTLAVDTGKDVGRGDIVRIALRALAAGSGPPTET